MGINLQKGQRIDLSKDGGSLSQLMVGLGWDEAPGLSRAIDCDASVIICGANGKLLDPSHINESCVYYGNLKHSSGAIVHQGDNLTGEGDGDDEQIMVNLPMIPANIDKMVFVVNIYDGKDRKQHFGLIQNAFIRIVNMSNNSEICRFNLSENYNGATGLVVGEVYRKNGSWKFNAIGQAVNEASRVDNLLRMYM